MNGAEPPDRDLVTLVAEGGDEAAFRMLYRRHSARLYRTALRLAAGDAAEAEEIAHDVWIRAVARFRDFQWRAQLPTWLISIAVNCARERRRSADRIEAIDVEPVALDRELETALARIDVERALARLPAGYRDVVVLHELEGFTHEEIAALLGIEPGTSKSQLHHARRRLRTLIGEERL
ncbi:MAG TPA: sigma-70 family RNA polymerase sigma factor [Gemmatimonadales bacterium]|jgi:RNA polymerase sigma-70 factor (ECF subfamily)|nr:sigma-70 family RNA polymerase sigma factor [Gemmatimonadales bacterium]